MGVLSFGKTTNAMEYGKINEKVAREEFEKTASLKVEESGLFIDIDHGFLGASPDGLVGERDIVEIKCLYSASRTMTEGQTLYEWVQKKNTFLEVNLQTKALRLKRNHNYFYQVQGQLHIAQKDTCYFIVFVKKEMDLFVEKIERDNDFWETKMLPKLSRFYRECVLPEIIIRNVRKGLSCRDSPYILEAQARAAHEKKNKTI